jgi:predicted transcriptional regulator
MKKKTATALPSNVIQLPSPKAAKLRSESKWGRQVMDQGFCILPSLLFRAQSRLGLKATHLALILQLAEFWWYDDNLPWPKKETIAQRMGLKEKQVQRIVRDLEQRGYLQRNTRMTPHGQTSNSYDLSGLVKKLQELAPEFAAVAAAKRQVERRGGLKAKLTVGG